MEYAEVTGNVLPVTRKSKFDLRLKFKNKTEFLCRASYGFLRKRGRLEF